jgi:hypothetical protein
VICVEAGIIQEGENRGIGFASEIPASKLAGLELLHF